MHVQAKERQMRRPCGNLGDAPSVVEWHAELVPALARSDVLMRGIDGDLGVDANRNGCAQPPSCGDSFDELQFPLGLDVEQQHLCIERLGELALRLPDSAKNDVAPVEAGAQRAEQLTTRNDVGPGAETP